MVSKHQVDESCLFLVPPRGVSASGITQTFGTFGLCCATEWTIGASIAPFGCVSNGARGSAVYFGRHWNRLASENAKSMRFNPLGIFIHDVAFPKLQVDASHLACLESCDGTISSKAHTFGTFGMCVVVEEAIGVSLAPFGYVLSEARLHLELRQRSSTCVSTVRRLVRTHVPCGTRAPCRACWPLYRSSPACQPMLPHALANLRTCAPFSKTPARRLIHDR